MAMNTTYGGPGGFTVLGAGQGGTYEQTLTITRREVDGRAVFYVLTAATIGNVGSGARSVGLTADDVVDLVRSWMKRDAR